MAGIKGANASGKLPSVPLGGHRDPAPIRISNRASRSSSARICSFCAAISDFCSPITLACRWHFIQEQDEGLILHRFNLRISGMGDDIGVDFGDCFSNPFCRAPFPGAEAGGTGKNGLP